LLRFAVGFERIPHLTSNIDNQIKPRSFLCRWLQIKKHVIRINADGAVGVTWRLLVLVVLNIVEWFDVKCCTVSDL